MGKERKEGCRKCGPERNLLFAVIEPCPLRQQVVALALHEQLLLQCLGLLRDAEASVHLCPR